MKELLVLLLWVALMVAPVLADPANTATVVVSSTPAGATVILDQQPVGKTPCTVSAAPGEHVLRIGGDDNYQAVEQNLSLQAGDNKAIDVELKRASGSYYAEALSLAHRGLSAAALKLLDAAADAPGPRPPEVDFYRGILLEDKGDLPHAEEALKAFIAARKTSAAAHYHLARVQQAEGQPAVEEYRTAILQAVPVAEAVMGAAGPVTADNVGELQAQASVEGAAGAKLQLAYVLEQQGDLAGASGMYRSVLETLATAQKVSLRIPEPIVLKMVLPDLMTTVTPAAPANTMYVLTADEKKLSAAWTDALKTDPHMAGRALVSAPEGGWTLVQAQAFDTQSADDIGKLGRSLSQLLATDVVFLEVSKPATAWYWYWSSGHLLDEYCSNPGHPGEVDYRTIRQWAGRPDVIVKACHGLPVSKLSGGKVTITDLNSLLYFYYPEMQTQRRASWRTPGTIMKLMVRFLGASDPPTRFGDRTGTFKPLAH